jgi:hypothetical protein
MYRRFYAQIPTYIDYVQNAAFHMNDCLSEMGLQFSQRAVTKRSEYNGPSDLPEQTRKTGIELFF